MLSTLYAFIFSKPDDPIEGNQQQQQDKNTAVTINVEDDGDDNSTLNADGRVCPTISFFPLHTNATPRNIQPKHPCQEWSLDWKTSRGLTTDGLKQQTRSRSSSYPLFQFLGRLRTGRVIISVLWGVLMSYLNCVASVIADSRSEQIINYDYSNPQYQKGGALQDIMHGLFEERQLGALSDYWAIGYGVIVMLHLLAGKDRAVSCPRFLWCLGILYFLRALSVFLTTLPSPSKYCKVPDYRVNLGLFGMFGPNPTTNIWIQGFWVMIGQRFTCHDLMFSGHTTFLQLCAHFFSLYTNYDWRVKWFSWLAAYTGSFLLLIQRWHYSVDVLVGIAITAGVVFGYHAAVWSYHAYMKIGQMGFQWSNPFTVFLRLVWWMDGLDYDLLTVSNNDPIVPNTNVSAEQRRRK